MGGEGGLDRNSPSLLAPLRISVAFGGTDGIGISANRNGTNCKGRSRFKQWLNFESQLVELYFLHKT
jgi:hypothetical protein